jgi:hypothetical protein
MASYAGGKSSALMTGLRGMDQFTELFDALDKVLALYGG